MTVCEYTITVPPPQIIEVTLAERGPAGADGPPGQDGVDGGGTFADENKDMAAETTAAPLDLVCAIPIAATPAGYVSVLVNGVSYTLGDGVTTQEFFFSGDALTPRLISAIQAGDLLYQGSGLLFNLDPTDSISFLFVR